MPLPLQMIPHHANAVNMAKILLKFEENMDEEVLALIHDIIK